MGGASILRWVSLLEGTWELVSEGMLRLGYYRSEDQVDDLLTKGVTNDVFKRLKMNIDMEDLEHLNWCIKSFFFGNSSVVTD